MLKNKYNYNIFPLRVTILEKIQRVEDLIAELSNLKGEDDDSAAEETLSMKFPTFTKTKLLMIHCFIEEQFS